jgi:hypothetical protein
VIGDPRAIVVGLALMAADPPDDATVSALLVASRTYWSLVKSRTSYAPGPTPDGMAKGHDPFARPVLGVLEQLT